MRAKFFLFALVLVAACLSFTQVKTKKFLDYFQDYKADSLVIVSSGSSEFKEDPSTPVTERGVSIDTSHFHVFKNDVADDLLYFSTTDGETGPMAYYKIKLNAASGYYLLLLRSGGEYWNSRFYACLYNSGEKKITGTLLVAEYFGDAGDEFICSSKLIKQDKEWTIYSHEYYQEPIDFHKYETDSLKITEVDRTTILELKDDHYHFKETSHQSKNFIK
jgi:hypothetical protein